MPIPATSLAQTPATDLAEEAFKHERDRLWPRVWQMACRIEQIPEVGDWIEYSVAGRSAIIVRTADGIRAHYNMCRHLGVEMVKGYGNCAVEGIICPFHGWRWTIEGRNTLAQNKHMMPGYRPSPADLALRRCRVELAAGYAFINFDEDAADLRNGGWPIPPILERSGVEQMRAERSEAIRLPINWKRAVEMFIDGSFAAFPPLAAAVAEPITGLAALIFPNFLLLPCASGLVALRIRASAPDACLAEISSLRNFAEGQEPWPIMQPDIADLSADEIACFEIGEDRPSPVIAAFRAAIDDHVTIRAWSV